jgi:hypothetical protein
MGVPELFIGALLGHGPTNVTEVYARVGLDLDPLRDIVEAIGVRIAALLAGQVDPGKEATEARAQRKLDRKKRLAASAQGAHAWKA